MGNYQEKFRLDIQALRGFAVLAVVFYHARIGVFSAGYLGVDIFFVISGFLITNLVKQAIENGSFRFSEFYIRRIKRLLPAAYVTFLVTAALAPIFLTKTGLADFQKELRGAISFTANLALLKQSGYFVEAAEVKPLLHTWSLSVEEQYYAILPTLLVFVARRFWFGAVLLILLGSLITCFLYQDSKAAFYLLTTRAWELMLGSVGAFYKADDRTTRIFKFAFWPALVALVLLPFIQTDNSYPGLETLLICLATIIVILSKHSVLAKGVAPHGLSKIGDLSYSLYLVHWPLFAFFHCIWFTETGADNPVAISLVVIALSLGLAYLLNRFVENPCRQVEITSKSRLLGSVLAASLGLILASNSLRYATASTVDYAHIMQYVAGFKYTCDFRTEFMPITDCRNSDRPDILVWGDSYAMHLIPGILEAGGQSVAQATKAVCAPLLGIAALLERDGYGQAWAKTCIRFNESVLAYLQRQGSPHTVVLASPFFQIAPNKVKLFRKMENTGAYQIVPAGSEEAVNGLSQAISALKTLGKRVVVVAPPPSGGFDVGRCLERITSHLPIFGVSEDCSISAKAYHLNRTAIIDTLMRVATQTDVKLIRFDDYLCDSQHCQTYIDGIFIYRDRGHFTYEGSKYLAKAISLTEQIRGINIMSH